MKEMKLQDLLYRQWKTLSDQEVKEMWYDWFCKESSLVNKGRVLLQRLNSIMYSHKIDRKNTYVWFKNNCPLAGHTFDDFRISDIETGEVIYTVVPRSGHEVKLGKAEVYGRENHFSEPLVSGTWKDVKRFFLNDSKTPEEDINTSNR